MRWPWRPAPGMVRIGHRELIRLQRDALHAAELEAQIAADTRQAALFEAQAGAYRLLQARCHEVGLPVDDEVRDEVLAGLPLTAEGRLHETAFLAQLDARVWARRENEVAAVMASARFDDGGDAR